MKRRPLTLALLLLLFAQAGPSCDPAYLKMVVLGDSHSDPERTPRFDWVPWTPPTWVVDDQATAGAKCWEIVPEAFTQPLHESHTMLVFCGTNDAGRGDWDLDVTAGWIEFAIDQAQYTGKRVVLVTPPPAFRDYPIDAATRNQRLAALRERILALAEAYEVDVADLWAETWSHPDPASLFADGLHFRPVGRLMMFQVIQLAVHRAQYQ